MLYYGLLICFFITVCEVLSFFQLTTTTDTISPLIRLPQSVYLGCC